MMWQLKTMWELMTRHDHLENQKLSLEKLYLVGKISLGGQVYIEYYFGERLNENTNYERQEQTRRHEPYLVTNLRQDQI